MVRAHTHTHTHTHTPLNQRRQCCLFFFSSLLTQPAFHLLRLSLSLPLMCVPLPVSNERHKWRRMLPLKSGALSHSLRACAFFLSGLIPYLNPSRPKHNTPNTTLNYIENISKQGCRLSVCVVANARSPPTSPKHSTKWGRARFFFSHTAQDKTTGVRPGKGISFFAPHQPPPPSLDRTHC